MSHPYSTDSSERRTIPLYLAGAAIASALGLGWIFRYLNWYPPDWIDAPSTFALYGLYYQLFRIWLWRWPVLRRFGIIKVPNLSGKWNGYVVTTYDEHHGKHEIAVTIQQTWTDLHIVLKSAYSESVSLIGGILTSDRTTLSYEYSNEPSSSATDTMHAHRGSARLILSDDGMSLSGDYYTGRDRTNYGSLSLTRDMNTRHVD